MCSKKEKLQIATYLIMNSPPGEVHQVLHDVKKVLKDERLLNSRAINKVLNEYNIKMMTSAQNPKDGSMCITSQYGLVSDDTFMDPKSGTVLKFDNEHETWTVVSEKKQTLPSDIVDQRVAIQKAMDFYADQHYRENCCVPLVYATKDGKITVCMTVRKKSLTNFWAGSWRAVYTFNVKKSGMTAMTSAINIVTHYFEDGNIQLHSSSSQEAKINVGNPNDTASFVAETIKKIENELHEGLESMYVDVHMATFRKLRRFLPYNRQPMNWDLAVHLINQDLDKPRY